MIPLLDTHAFLWFVWGSVKLSGPARALMVDPANALVVGMASCWEIAIKVGVGRLTLAGPYDAFVSGAVRDNGLSMLDIEMAHAAAVAVLPFHRRDPLRPHAGRPGAG